MNNTSTMASVLYWIGIIQIILGIIAGLVVLVMVSAAFGLGVIVSGIVSACLFLGLSQCLKLLEEVSREKQGINYRLEQLIAWQQEAMAQTAPQSPSSESESPAKPWDPQRKPTHPRECYEMLKTLPSGREIRAALEDNRSLFDPNFYQEMITEVDRLIDMSRLYGDMKRDILLYLSKTLLEE